MLNFKIMINSIISFSIRNKLVVGLFVLGLVFWGGYSLSKLPIDALPDITSNQVQVITQSPALATSEVEKFITYPPRDFVTNDPQCEGYSFRFPDGSFHYYRRFRG
jgi:cobalt-zinc-cadmium resistance protein CzcA